MSRPWPATGSRTDAPLVRLGAERAVVRAACVPRRPADALVELEINPGKANRARLNRSPVPRAREVLGMLRTVLFAPEDLALVKGDPAERRRFLDDLLVARTPRFAGVRADYDRVLKQRNALLKSAVQRCAAAAATCHARRLGRPPRQAGAELLAGRLELVDALRRWSTRPTTRSPRPVGRPGSSYQCSLGADVPLVVDRDLLAAALLAALSPDAADRARARCHPGRPAPRRPALTLGELPAKGYASHGESWSLALALRLASYDLLREPTAASPVLILDDVFAELDSRPPASGWPSWSRRPSRCWSPRPCRATCPRLWRRSRYDVDGWRGDSCPMTNRTPQPAPQRSRAGPRGPGQSQGRQVGDRGQQQDDGRSSPADRR